MNLIKKYMFYLFFVVILVVINTNKAYAFKVAERFHDPNFAALITNDYFGGDADLDVSEQDLANISIGMEIYISSVNDLTGIELLVNAKRFQFIGDNIRTIPDDFYTTYYPNLATFIITNVNSQTGEYIKILDLKNAFNSLMLPKLQHLYLDGLNNNIFPDTILTISTLIGLRFYSSNISYIPNGISNLVNLLYANFSNNLLAKLPDDFILWGSRLPDTMLENSASVFLINNCLTSITIEQYNHMNRYYLYQINNQNYIGDLDNAIIGKDYKIDSISALEQFTHYGNPGMVFTYELYNDNDLTTPIATKLNRVVDDITVNNGVVTIKKEILNQLGSYSLKAIGTGGDVDRASYTLHFRVVEGPISPDEDNKNSDGDKNKNPDIDSKLDTSDNKTLANTGNSYYINSIISLVISIISYNIYVIKRIKE